MDLKQYIRDGSDFPSKGIIFKDIAPLLQDLAVLREAIDHLTSVYKDQRIESVVTVDDLLATGGTMSATINLVEKLGGKVHGVAFLAELEFLGGGKKLKNYNPSL